MAEYLIKSPVTYKVDERDAVIMRKQKALVYFAQNANQDCASCVSASIKNTYLGGGYVPAIVASCTAGACQRAGWSVNGPLHKAERVIPPQEITEEDLEAIVSESFARSGDTPNAEGAGCW